MRKQYRKTTTTHKSTAELNAHQTKVSQPKQPRRNLARNLNPGLLFLGLVVVAAVVVIGMALLTANRSSSVVIQLITPIEYREQYALPDKPHFLLDVRTPEEFANGHIAEAVNISVDVLGSRLSEVPHDVPVIVYCRSGNRSATAAKLLKDAGYTSIYDLGGITAWIAQGMPVTS